MSDRRTFPTLDVFAAASGFILREGGTAGLREVLAFAAGEPVYSHQIPRVGRELAAALAKRDPVFEKALSLCAKTTPDNWREVASRLTARLGETIEISPMTAAEHVRRDPIEELEEMMRAAP